MGLRAKVLSGFFILALMLSLAGGWSIYELQKTSSAVEELLTDNYKSINAGQVMLEALEREDSGVLLILLGQPAKGRQILDVADKLFDKQVAIARSNVTVPGETELIEAITARYEEYKSSWNKPLLEDPEQDELSWYLERTHGAFLEAKATVNNLISENQDAMYAVSSHLRQGADRALMPGIVAIVAALVFSLLFSYFVHVYMVGPIVRITRAVGRFVQSREEFEVRLDAKDELSQLVDSIRDLASQVQVSDGQTGPTK